MAINNFHFKLDIEREDYIPKFRLKQYDTAIFYASIYKNGLPYHFENEQIKMFVKKQDGTIVYQEDNISIEDDEVKINVKNQALVCSGLTYAELEFKSSDGQVTSSTFLYEVKEKVGSDKAIESVTDIATLDKLKKYMEDAKKELERFKIEFSKIEDLVANKDKLEGQNKEAKENIEELGKVLKDANNITSDEGKYVTRNNIVSESTNGYIQDLKLYGRSLVNNVIKREPFRSTSNIAYASITKSVPLIGEEVYTFIPYNLPPFIKQMYLGNSDSSVVYIPRTMNLKSTTFIAKDSLPIDFAIPHFYTDSGVTITPEQLSELEKSKFIIVKGDLTSNPPPYFEGLVNVENNEGLNITTCNANLFDESLLNDRLEDDGYYHFKSSGNTRSSFFFGIVDKNNKQITTMTPNNGIDLTYINLEGCKVLIGLNGDVKDDKVLFPISNFPISNFPVYKGCDYEIINPNHIRVKSIFIQKGYDNPKYNPHKSDKKPILFKDTDNKWKPLISLRGLNENNCDIVDSTKNKYTKIIKEIIEKGEGNWQVADGSKSKTIMFLRMFTESEKCEMLNNNTNVLCDKFKSKYVYSLDEEGIFINRTAESSNGGVYIRINQNRLETRDVQGFNKWLQNNNTTYQYKGDKELTYGCLDILTRAFRDKTMLSIDSRAIDPDIFYFVPTGFLSADNSICEKVETLDKYSEKNTKDINDLNFNMEQNYFNINRGYVNDFNDATQEGKYYLHSTSLIPNSPPTSQTSLYGIVQVFYKNYNELFQLVALHNSELWIRFRNGHNQWNSWSKILNSQDFETQHGSNGFLKFPNGSVLQFGSGVTNNGVLRINFKLTFAKSDDIVLTGSALDPSPQTVGFRSLTTTGCELTCSWSSNPVGVKWFAFGKIQ
ncbi:BppU family phage baseplate upper protein [Paraclostridium bifermentans]|uniref:BppU family phage baseplate upper protein n=1 Tax=Paraclostridium bifermentans TaxID=1490 RepID=UPI0018AA1B9A|nr:BppU family phage baseplate upper protein [Paraclostridium bifermentans]